LFYTIYKITNILDNKIYIGKHQTKNINDNYMGSGKHLKRAIKKYGIENFVKEFLFIFDNEEEMNIKEKELVSEEFCLREDTYNMCVGGQGGFGYINQHGLNWTYEKNKRISKFSTFSKEERSFYGHLGGKVAITNLLKYNKTGNGGRKTGELKTSGFQTGIAGKASSLSINSINNKKIKCNCGLITTKGPMTIHKKKCKL